MSERARSVPVLNLVPKRTRLLSLWNPLDYLVIFYWALFFPQALRWYVQRFGNQEYRDARGQVQIWEALRNDHVQRRFVAQGILAVFVFDLFLVSIFYILGVPISWIGALFSTLIGIGFLRPRASVLGIPERMAVGISSSIVGVVAFGLAFSQQELRVSGGALSLSLGLIFGVIISTSLGVVSIGFPARALGGVTVCFTMGIAGYLIGFSGGIPFEESLSFGERVLRGFVGFAGASVVAIVVAVRLVDWLVLLPVRIFRPEVWSRVTWLPLPGAKRQMADWLSQDWRLGVRNLNQVLTYSLQFVPTVAAINEVLSRSMPGECLRRVALLAEESIQWDLIRFGSASLKNRLLQEAIEGLFWVPLHWQRHWKNKYPADLRLDTPARIACAGFWWWYSRESRKAEEAFAKVQKIPFGAELHGISQAIAAASETLDLEGLGKWREGLDWIEQLPEERLRPGSLNALAMLQNASEEASVAFHASAPLNRSAALGRAAAELDRLESRAEEICPYPEWPLIQGIAKSWLKIVIEAAGAAGEEVLREPVLNPYEGYSGLPVTGDTFIGRHDVFLKFETLWASGETLPVVFLYGHRRMGKTSILRNLEHAAPRRTLLVYLDMQDSGFVDHTGELLLDLAEGVHRRAVEVGLDAGPPPDEARYERLGEARRELNALFTRLDSQMEGRRLILAIDEFERIEKAIADGRVEADVLAYLRSLNQRHRWLALVFGGLHTLDEMGRDYQSAFYGQTEHVRVGYLSREDTERLVTQPHPDFALEYASELRDELYRLTFGQPFLLQRICWEMVNRWNERFLKEGEKTPRVLTLADLEPVLDDDLYSGAAYYFDGVWSNVTEEERRAMAILAGREEGWDRESLAARVGATPEELARIVSLLRRHDVITEGAGGIRFASELMRRWVVRSGFAQIDSEEA